jgi:PAS domain-containing protein
MPRNYFRYQVQSEVTPRMRTVLIDWILEVHYRYRMYPTTLWLTLHIFDRFLDKEDIARGKMQLVGITALFIACKFEEVYTPAIKDCVHLCDNAFAKKEILQMEARMLHLIDYQLVIPTGYHFMIKLLNRLKAAERVCNVCYYVAERNMYEIDMLDFSPKIYGCASVLAGLRAIYWEIDGSKTAHELWNSTLREESGLTVDDIIGCTCVLLDNMNRTHVPSAKRKVDVVKKKYEVDNVSGMYFARFDQDSL